MTALRAPGTNEHTGVNALPVPESTYLVIPRRTEKTPFTGNKETDTRSALTRGLAEYMSDLVVESPSGRQLRFQEVFSSWAEPEDGARYPSAIAYTTTNGTYEAKALSPSVAPNCKIPEPDGRYLVSPSDYVDDVVVEIWATDPEERMILVGALEDAFNPFTGQYGFTLGLPHYHNVRATFEPLQMGYMDSETDATQRSRRAMFTLNGRLPLIKLASFPGAKPRPDVVAVGPNVIVEVTD